MSKNKMESLIHRIESQGIAGDQEAIKDLIGGLPRRDANELALRWVNECIAKKSRMDTLKIERDAAAQEMHETVSTRPSPVSRNPKPRIKEYDAELEDRVAEIGKRTQEKIAGILEDLTLSLRLEWTQELLESTFAMADGSRVTWGEATVDHHANRIAMFQNNAVANLEGAARHQQAIEEITSSGFSNLHQMQEVKV